MKTPVERSLSAVCLLQALIAVPAVVVFFGSLLASLAGGFAGPEKSVSVELRAAGAEFFCPCDL